MDNSTKPVFSHVNYLQKRFVGSLVDKVFICILTFVVVIVISFFNPNISGDIGTFCALFHMDINDIYNTAVGHVMINYPDERIIHHQYEIDKYCSSLKSIEVSMLLLFSLINILYYLLSEVIYKASLGKKLQNLILVSYRTGVKITFVHILFRVIVFALMMLLSFIFRWTIGVNYYVIIIVFFVMMDLPIFFTNRSLLDLLTNTKLVFAYQQITQLNNVENDDNQMGKSEEPSIVSPVAEKAMPKISKNYRAFIYYTLICFIINLSLITIWIIGDYSYHHFLGIKIEPTGIILLILTLLFMNIPAMIILPKVSKKEYSWDFMLLGTIRKQVYKLARNESEVRAFVVLFCYPFFVLGQLPFGIFLLGYLVPFALILSLVLTVRWILAGEATKENQGEALFKDYYLIMDLHKDATQD